MSPIEGAHIAASILASVLITAAVIPAAADSPGQRAATGDRWAAVGSDGTLARGKGAVDVVRSDVGRYIVGFNRGIKDCVYVAAIGLAGTSGTESPGTVVTRRARRETKKVDVRTFDPKGLAADHGFFLHVVCQ